MPRRRSNLKTLTRTDFLLQFVWKPPKPEELPKTEEEQKTKLKDMVDKMTEAEKNNPAVTMPKAEDLQAASLKKSEELIRSSKRHYRAGGAAGHPGLARSPARPGGACARRCRASRTRAEHVRRRSDVTHARVGEYAGRGRARWGRRRRPGPSPVLPDRFRRSARLGSTAAAVE